MNRVTFMLLFFWLIALTVQSQNISHDHSFICATQIDGNSNNPLNSNNPGAISSNGQDLTPRGTQRVLVVFAGFEGGGFDGAIPQQPGDPDLIELDGWINRFSDDYQLPEYVKVADDGRITTTPLFFNDVADWNDPAIMSDPENRRSASNSLFEMSRPNGDDFRLIGDVFSDETGTPVLVTIPRDGGYTRWRDANRALLDEMVALNDDPDYYAQFDTRENKPDFNFDNSVNPVPDGVIDFMIIIWRHSTDGDWEGNQPVDNMEDWFGTGGGYWSGNGNFGSTPPITQTIGGINFGFKEGFVQTKGAGLDVSLFLHEFAHATHRCPHTSGTNNVVGNYFYGAATGNGSTSYPGIFENVQTGWERWFRGHITPIEPTTNGTFVLDDFIESGDALRIEIPFSGGQHLWVEHHTDDNPLYNHRWANSVIPFFGPGVNGNLDFTVPNTDKGIYAYVENITDNMKVTNTFVIGANGLKFLNASGHHDFMPDPSAAPVTTAWGGREIRNYNKGQENPIGGISPWQKIRYNINDEDEDDVIDINTGSNLGNGNEWDYIEREDDLITNRWMGFNPANSGERSPAFTTGDVLGMDSNPALMNYPIYDRGNSQLEPFFLNGLEVKITSASTGGDAVVDVKFKQTHISKDLRWTGNIILPDITEDDDFDLILDVDKAIDLDLSGTVNRHTLHPTLNDFFNPTTFTISSDSKIKLEESAVIRIKNHSTMIVEDGAEVVLKDKACILVEETGTLDLRGNNIKLLGKDAVIIVKGKLITDDDVDFTFDGSGYVEFHNTHTLELGNNSDFDLRGKGKGERFMRLRENTQLNIDDRFIRLLDGEVQYYEGSEIFVSNEGQAHLDNTEFEGLTNVETKGIVANQFTRLTIRGCLFHDLHRGAEISESLVTIAGLFEIKSSVFSNNNASIHGYDLDYIKIIKTKIMEGKSGGVFDNISTVNLMDCEVSDFDIQPQEGDLFTGAVRLNNIGRMIMNNGFISNNYVGICSKEGSLANVLMTNGATIENNRIGIEIYGIISNANNVDGGGVVIDCSNLKNNEVGLYGIDVTLDIDASQSHIGSNDFEHIEGQSSFFIIYEDKIIPSPPIIPAFLNYWGENCPPTNYNIANGAITFDTEPSPQCQDVRLSCERLDAPVPPRDRCDERVPSDRDMIIQDQYSTAFLNFWAGNQSTAEEQFSVIAEIDYEDIRGDICKEKVQLARTMVNTNTNNLGLGSNEQNNGTIEGTGRDVFKQTLDGKSVVSKNISIYPNPTQGQFTVDIPEGIYSVQLINTIGQTILQNEVSGTTVISTNSINKGVYLLQVYDSENQVWFREKLIVE